MEEKNKFRYNHKSYFLSERNIIYLKCLQKTASLSQYIHTWAQIHTTLHSSHPACFTHSMLSYTTWSMLSQAERQQLHTNSSPTAHTPLPGSSRLNKQQGEKKKKRLLCSSLNPLLRFPANRSQYKYTNIISGQSIRGVQHTAIQYGRLCNFIPLDRFYSIWTSAWLINSEWQQMKVGCKYLRQCSHQWW